MININLTEEQLEHITGGGTYTADKVTLGSQDCHKKDTTIRRIGPEETYQILLGPESRAALSEQREVQVTEDISIYMK